MLRRLDMLPICLEVWMATRLKKRGSLTLREILEAVRSLTPDDQARLRDELAGLTQVYLTRPDDTPEANRRGWELAEKLRDDLSANKAADLDHMMSQLRGRTWLS
jgi:hypothetical protein